MFDTINKSSKAIISEVLRGGIARICIDDKKAVFQSLILVIDNKITLVKECIKNGSNEYLKRPTVETVSKAQALEICEQLRKRNLVDFIADDMKDDYLMSIEEIQEEMYEY